MRLTSATTWMIISLILPHSRASFDAEIPAKILEAYLCTGDSYWPLGLSTHNANSLLKGSVIMAHYIICAQTRDFPGEYRDKMIEAAIGAAAKIVSSVQKLNKADTGTCLEEKMSSMLFENLCGSNNIWNFREGLLYIRYTLKGQTSSMLLKGILNAVNILLEGKNVELFLSSIATYCPESPKYCTTGLRQKRGVRVPKSLKEIDFTLVEDLKRRKRAVDPQEMMLMFNKMICNPEIIGSLAGYYDKTLDQKMDYSRVWLFKNISEFWCCFAQHLEELYKLIPVKK